MYKKYFCFTFFSHMIVPTYLKDLKSGVFYLSTYQPSVCSSIRVRNLLQSCDNIYGLML